MIDRAQRLWSWGKRLPVWVFDTVLALMLVAPLVISVVVDPPNTAAGDYRPINALGILLVLGAIAPIAVRRLYPLQALITSAVFIVVFVAAEFFEGALPLIALILIYTVGAWCRPREIVVGYGVMLVSLVSLWIIGIPDYTFGDLFSNSIMYAASCLFGWMVQSRRLRLEAAEERAALLEREQEEERARAIAQERLHIAQELHDVVAHSMSVIAVQAGVGMHVVDQDPAEAKRALENISATSRSSLAELRRLLGVLRDDGTGASYAPAPGLRDLERLAQDVTDAGVPVSLRVEGSIDDVPPGIDSTAYRIVQEALTNVLKHAGPASASVVVHHDGGALRLEVQDDGRGVNGRSADSGHGLVGMRERVAVYGGTLEAGPVAGGGFRVAAVVPYAAAPSPAP